MPHRFTVTSCNWNEGETEKLKKSTKFVTIMETEDTHDRSLISGKPECEGLYDVSPLDSAQVTETFSSGRAFLNAQKRLELREIRRNGDASGTYTPTTPKTPEFHLLTLNHNGDHKNNFTREGTPMSIGTVSDIRSLRWKKRGDEAFVTVISALYAKILVIMGLAFPMSEVISSHITSSTYLGFYIYLYLGSILYLLYVFFSLMKEKISLNYTFCGKRDSVELPEEGFLKEKHARPRAFSNETTFHHGSFYLRIGAVAFGVGSMIYSCLEFGQYFEVDVNSRCHDILMAITPAARMLFTFIQMYFIFLNAKMTIRHNKAVAHFGLMHMIATNLCVWLNVIIEETKHEILFDHHEEYNTTKNDSLYHGKIRYTKPHKFGEPIFETKATSAILETFDGSGEVFDGVAEALISALDILKPQEAIAEGEISLIDECRRSEVLGKLVQEASPLLFPCAIEYSLICAAILYVMWKNLATAHFVGAKEAAHNVGRRSRHHYSIDCARANKGLFSGIFVLVSTIISLIMFFALINKQDYKAVAIMEVNMARLILYSLSFLAVLIGLYQVREMRYHTGRNMVLDDVLLIFGQIGVISYNTFTIIAAHFKLETEDTSLVLSAAIAALLQALSQTLFILDASRRSTYTSDQQRRKPGREVVTFLLVSNFAMWTVNTLEKSRADVNPVQLQFYGKWPWIIITNVSMPLAIFYRFHSTVVLCEIWKRCYKAKHELV